MMHVLLVFISVVLLGFPAEYLKAQDYIDFIKKGDEYYREFNSFRALKEYEKAYKIAPDNYEVLLRLTRVYNDVGEDIQGIWFDDKKKVTTEVAKKYFEKATWFASLLHNRFPDKAEPYFLLALSYGHLALFKGGREKVKLAKDIEQNCLKAIELDPNFIPAYIALGVYYREVAGLNWFLKSFARSLTNGSLNGTYRDSERVLLKALELNPSIIRTHFELAKTYKALGKEDKVIYHLKKVLELPIVDHQDKVIKSEAGSNLNRLLAKKYKKVE
ncbi:MAG: hypothetical protein KatS3mg078_0305 [Deltaproteobacteria bacterium]|jgi:tetratricopeptide (TPR) repeat protein|nr:MAG: hypothetical protein KatS3mg078_0305 [Deltaproteobacteria bacterium]